MPVTTEQERVLERAQILAWFTYHPPIALAQGEAYEKIRAAGLAMANLLTELCPLSAMEFARAVEHIRAAVFWANASIACALPRDVAVRDAMLRLEAEARKEQP